MNGVIPLWKPAGMTSHDCVARIRKLLKMKRVGHTGTLDPEVEGVLPICLGKATKIVSLLTESAKEYEAEVSLGKQTTTEDQTGEIIAENTVDPSLTLDRCHNALQAFQGQIQQTPPMYSAVKVNGKRLYEYARAGIEVERPTRTVEIHDVNMLSDDLKWVNEKDVRFSFRVRCSSGTYIRTLCVNIGEKLGLPAHMSHLVRTKAASFSAEDTVTFSDIEAAISNDDLSSVIHNLATSLHFLPAYIVSDAEEERRFIQGQVLDEFVDLKKGSLIKIERPDQTVLAIYQHHPTKPGKMKPFKVFEE